MIKKKSNMRNYWVGLTLVIAVSGLIGAFVWAYITGNLTFLADVAPANSMRIDPANPTLAQGQTLVLNIYADAGSETVEGFNSELTFANGNLTLVGLTDVVGSDPVSLPSILSQANASGKIPIKNVTTFSGEKKIATVTFSPKNINPAEVLFTYAFFINDDNQVQITNLNSVVVNGSGQVGPTFTSTKTATQTPLPTETPSGKPGDFAHYEKDSSGKTIIVPRILEDRPCPDPAPGKDQAGETEGVETVNLADFIYFLCLIRQEGE